MKRYERIMSTIKEESGLLEMIQLGARPEEVKQGVIESLEPYFENRHVVVKLAVDRLVPESISLARLQKQPWFFQMFEECLATYRNAKRRDAQGSFQCRAAWQTSILQSVSKYWSVLHLEEDKSTLEPEEFLHECLSNIGDIIEGITKPYLKALLHQITVTEGVATATDYIDSLSLGKIVGELTCKSGYPELFMPPPWGIRLNQWRNIAHHSTARIDGAHFVCWYGRTPNVKTICLSRNDLLKVVHSVFCVFKTLKLADTIYFIDNAKEIGRLLPQDEMRVESKFMNLAAGLASQGFVVVEHTSDANEAKLIVRDVSRLNPNERRLHASQFLFPLWVLTRSRQVMVEYREKDDTPNLRVSADSATCQRIYDGEVDPMTLAETMKIVDLKTKSV